MGRRAPRAFLRSGQKNARRGSDNRNAARRVSAIPAPPAACRREQRARPCCASRRPAAATGLAQCSGATLFKGREKENFKGLWSAGKNLRLPGRPVLPFPLPAEAGPDKVFWRGGGARGGGRTFCSQKGGLPLAQIFSAPTAGDPARAGRWPRPHGRERWRPCPPGRRWYGPDAAPGCRRGRRGPGRARPAP